MSLALFTFFPPEICRVNLSTNDILHDSIKAKNPLRFQRTSLFLRVLGILELHHFRLPVCRFAIDLFDKKVMRQIVLEEDQDLDLDDDAALEGEESEDEQMSGDRDLFDGEGEDEEFAEMGRVSSSRSQPLTDEEEEDAALFGDGGAGSREELGRVESGVQINAGRMEDMSATAILRGNG